MGVPTAASVIAAFSPESPSPAPLDHRLHRLIVIADSISAAVLGIPPPEPAKALGIAATVARFDWTRAEGDVLKGLYHALIDRAERHGGGEHYTPDWLAAKVVRRAVGGPLEQRVLDPACGSGTFLFEAVRHVLAAAAHLPAEERVALACARVSGIDVSPVAVAMARATYLLALAPDLPGLPVPDVPVRLGDALACRGDPADVLVGNPPWLAFRHMPAALRERCRALALEDGVYVGGRLATQNDLAALFTVRAARLHLCPGGRLAMILPLAALSRGQFAALRCGLLTELAIAWEEAWTLDESVRPLFPVPACVLFGRRDGAPRASWQVKAFSGVLPERDPPFAVADACLTIADARLPSPARFHGGSPYRKAFRQGATLVPRMLCLVERTGAEAPGRVRSRRSGLEKPPWRALPALEAEVAADGVRPVLLGESILPHRLLRSFDCVIDDAGWMDQAQALWATYTGSAGMTLFGRWNYHKGLTSQFPIAPLRVVYAKAGSLPAACLVRDERAVVDHMLYWMAVEHEAEGFYLAAILNSEAARFRVAGQQARGQFGARHFDKVMFNLSIARFDPNNTLHTALAGLAAEAERLASHVCLPATIGFRRARAMVRASLAEAGVTEQMERLVAASLGEP